MNSDISNKWVVLIYLITAIVSGYYIYGATLGGTFELKGQYDEQMSRSESGRDFSLELAAAQKQLNKIEKVISADAILTGKIQQMLIEKVNGICDKSGMKLTEVPAPVSYNQAGYEIITNQLEVEGDYLGLVELVSKMENEFERARIVSVNYYSRKNLQNNKYKLYARIYFQNIKSI
ncbi:MAG: hypothetical protein JKY54_14875 [Flavobacteriales bacterium]|nr:hypothetical protein [Flavobacteriales bacterium]